MRILNPVVMLALGAALLAGHAVAIDPPPRQGATRDASRSEPPQPQPEVSTDPQDAVKAAESDAKTDTKTDTKTDAANESDTRSEASADAKGKLVKPSDPPHSGAATAKAPSKQTVKQPGKPPVKAPVKRRAVQAQQGDNTATTYRSTLAVPPPALRAPMPQSTLPPGPVVLNGCTGGHCSDQSGQRYNPVGTTLVSPQGRLCSNNGISVSCY